MSIPSRTARARHTRALVLCIATTSLVGVACELPTSPPDWDTTWSIDLPAKQVSPASYLPSTVRLTADAFEIDVPPTSVHLPLGALCTATDTASGSTTVKPGIETTFSLHVPITGSAAAMLASNNVLHVTLAHSLPFDPLRPSTSPGAPAGKLHLTLKSEGVVVGTLDIDGATDSLPGQVARTLSVTLLPGAVIGESVDVGGSLTSPESDAFHCSTADALDATGQVAPLRLAWIAAPFRDTTVTWSGSAAIPDLTSHLDSASVRVTVTNPWSVRGSLTLVLGSGEHAVVRTVKVASGTTVLDVGVSGDEIRAFQGTTQPVTMAASLGADNSTGGAGTVRLTPDQRLGVHATLRFTLSTLAHPTS